MQNTKNSNKSNSKQTEASKQGFDWDNINDVINKVKEEINELEQAISISDSHEEIINELGDVLFSVLNVARHLAIDPSVAMEYASKKFVARYTK